MTDENADPEQQAQQPLSLSQNKSDHDHSDHDDDEEAALMMKKKFTDKVPISSSQSIITSTGLKVLLLLAFQNCTKNLVVRYVMKDQPKFLTSAAVIGSETLKLSLSVSYILFVEKQSLSSIITFIRQNWYTTMLVLVPASAYNLQTSLEYVAMANIDAAMFSVLVQSKLLFTAMFAFFVLRKTLKKIQIISLTLLTCGVCLCNVSKMVEFTVGKSTTVGTTSDSAAASSSTSAAEDEAKMMKGIMATLGIAISSGLASVYTERVIKGSKTKATTAAAPSLAYTQVQLASMSLVAIGLYAAVADFQTIIEYGLWHNFTSGAFLTVILSALGGLTVAAVLKYADSILKGYATALSVVLTGFLSMMIFGTSLNIIYGMGVINVVIAVLLYNGGDNLQEMMC